MRDRLFLGMTFRKYLQGNLTPFNGVCAIILAVGLPVMAYRFVYGLGPSTNLSDTNPWGIWIGFDTITGMALAAGGFVMGAAVHLFGQKEYHVFVRPAILTGFLGYLFAIVGLVFDLGRYYRLFYPMFVSLGVNSILFLVAWSDALYLTCQFVEWCPAIFEWLNWKKLRNWFVNLTLGATVFGVILSTLHQSALGTLFILMPSKLHPLWYSSYIPVYFFFSAVIAGISMVILESALSHRFFHGQIQNLDRSHLDRLVVGLGKAASVLLFTYFVMKTIGVAHDGNWNLLFTPYGYWFLLEMLGFVLLPAFLYAYGVRTQSARWVRGTSVLTVLGIALNRINHTIVAFNWNAEERYFPHWMEVTVTVTIVTIGILTFRWIVNRMPILHDHPDFAMEKA
jgi:Ni/Fe-hydrogenase subunit HybB-like protein